MDKISSGIEGLDLLVDSLHIGDNVVWEVDAGTDYDLFVLNFLRDSFTHGQQVVYISFNRSPQTIVNEISPVLRPAQLTLIDCFTAGKGKSDEAFLRFYEQPRDVNVVRIADPRNIEDFSRQLARIEDQYTSGVRYVFDSLTGMQDLWGNENDTYQFFTYMCPRLYDLGTVAYWILEKDAHSPKFKANLRHITQVVFDLYKRRESLYIKALKLAGRQDREAFKPHLYEISGGRISVSLPKKEVPADIGRRIRDLRTTMGMSQKELANKVNLTPSYISQLENNQISPSLSSFLQICNVLAVNPGEFLGTRKQTRGKWILRKDAVFSKPQKADEGFTTFTIVSDEGLSARIILLPAGGVVRGHFLYRKGPEFLHVLNGSVDVTIQGVTDRASQGDSLYLRETFPSEWRNEGADDAQILLVSG